jgi:GxxExxY protein
MPYEDEITPYGDLCEPPEELDRLARAVIGAAIEVHKQLGAGLPEEAYEGAMCIELTAGGISFERQKPVDILYKGIRVSTGRIDLLVEGKLILEIKSCESLIPIHRLQVLTYVRIIKQPLGLLINFNVPILKQGIRRIIQSNS